MLSPFSLTRTGVWHLARKLSRLPAQAQSTNKMKYSPLWHHSSQEVLTGSWSCSSPCGTVSNYCCAHCRASYKAGTEHSICHCWQWCRESRAQKQREQQVRWQHIRGWRSWRTLNSDGELGESLVEPVMRIVSDIELNDRQWQSLSNLDTGET
jgi:hypothetical protein